MYPKNKLALLGLAISLMPAFVMAQGQDEASKKLIESARYWQSKENYVRAATIWTKVLLTNPKETEAIYGIAQDELKKNNMSGVNLSLDKLKKVDPNSRYIALLEQDIKLSSPQNSNILYNAQVLAASNKMNEAVAQYNILLGGKEPQGSFAIEYYAALSHTNVNGVINARAGLERISKQYPQNNAIKLELGKTLLLQENTRLGGIELLSKLANDPVVGSDASESWRLGLIWYKIPNRNAFAVFETYLKTHPDDAEVQALLNAGIKQQSSKGSGGGDDNSLRAADAYELAKRSLAIGDDIGARAALDKSLKLDPDNPWARLALARLYIKSG